MAPSRFSRREMSPATIDVVIFGPGRMEPPGMNIAGMFRRAIAFRCAGIDLSQLEDMITPSQATALP